MMNKSHAGDNQKLIASNVFYLLLIDMSYSPWRKFGNLLSSLIADMKVFQLHKNYHYSLHIVEVDEIPWLYSHY